MGAKLHAQKGNSPRSQPKVPKYELSGEGSEKPQTARMLA